MLCTMGDERASYRIISMAVLLLLPQAIPAAPTGGHNGFQPILRKPFAELISYPQLLVLTMEYHHLSELYTRVLETNQLIQWLDMNMQQRLFSTGAEDFQTYSKCIAPERSVEDLTGFNVSVRLTEDLLMLAEFTGPLHSSTDYEKSTFGGQFETELEDIRRMYTEILEGLANVTGVAMPVVDSSKITASGQDDGSPSLHSVLDSTGTGYGYATGPYLEEYEDGPEYTGDEPYDRCQGAMNSIYQYQNIDELWTAMWYTQLDLHDTRKRMIPN